MHAGQPLVRLKLPPKCLKTAKDPLTKVSGLTGASGTGRIRRNQEERGGEEYRSHTEREQICLQ